MDVDRGPAAGMFLDWAVLPLSAVPGALEPGIQRGGGGIKEGKFIKEGFSMGIYDTNRYHWFSTGTIQVRYSCIRPVNMTLRTAAL